ncbi:MAG: DUF805 domain-containing protein [Hyphomicrobiaceae bacterium]
MKILKSLFGIRGRMNRASYLLVASLATCLPTIPLYFLGFDVSQYSIGQWLTASIACIPCIWLLIAANTQRLHDLDMSGWVQLVFVANYSITFAIFSATPILFKGQHLWALLALNILALPIAAWAIWLMVELFCSGGKDEANRFGAPRSFRDLLRNSSVLPKPTPFSSSQ